MDAREEISRWLALLVQLSSEAESDQIDGDIKMLTGVTQQLSSELAKRNTYLVKQCRKNKPAISQKAPQKGPQKEKGVNSKDDAQGSGEGSQKQREELSSIQQGIRQADLSMADQQRALRSQVYRADNDDASFRKTAKAIAR
ncbi:MAG: hypothetical protein RL764_101 [Pseudomonadota bacterium]|jgi:hypothetical protein